MQDLIVAATSFETHTNEIGRKPQPTGNTKGHFSKPGKLDSLQAKLKSRNENMVHQKPKRFNQFQQEVLSNSNYVPKRHDRVAIIGAGPAGLHMAYLLDELNFKNVTILEKANRIAGKSLTRYNYEPFVPQEFGTCYTIPYKYGELRRIAKEIGYGSFEEVPVPPRHVFTDYADRESITQEDWLISEKIKKWPYSQLPLTAAIAAVGIDLIRYNKHHARLFSRNLEEIIKETNMSFEQYLKKHGFQDLAPLFSLANTVQGYGYIAQVPAFYGLWWNNPEEVNGFLASAVHLREQPAYILRDGFQMFWEFLYKNRQFQVEHNVDITRIERHDSIVRITDSSNTVREYDFVIITSNLRDSLQFIDADEEEIKLLSGLKARSTLTTTLVSVKHTDDPVAISSWTSSLNPKNRARLMTVRNSYKIFFPENVGKKSNDFLICYQYEPEATPDNEDHRENLRDTLIEDLQEAGYENITVHEQHVWPYFQRYDQQALNAHYPIKLMNRQGKRRTWYAGASTTFESVHDCMEYNKLLVDRIRRQEM